MLTDIFMMDGFIMDKPKQENRSTEKLLEPNLDNLRPLLHWFIYYLFSIHPLRTHLMTS